MALMPKGTVTRISPVWGGGYFISTASRNKSLAWAFDRWLILDRKATQLAAAASATCGIPGLRASDKVFATGWQGIPGGAACALSLKQTENFAIVGNGWDKITNTIIGPSWDKFLHNKISAKDLAKLLDSQLNAALRAHSS